MAEADSTVEQFFGVTSVPMKFRDVYWCWILNEPVILEYRDGHPFCNNCAFLDTGAVDGAPSPEFLERHTFRFHIQKMYPAGEQAEGGSARHG